MRNFTLLRDSLAADTETFKSYNIVISIDAVKRKSFCSVRTITIHYYAIRFLDITERDISYILLC